MPLIILDLKGKRPPIFRAFRWDCDPLHWALLRGSEPNRRVVAEKRRTLSLSSEVSRKEARVYLCVCVGPDRHATKRPEKITTLQVFPTPQQCLRREICKYAANQTIWNCKCHSEVVTRSLANGGFRAPAEQVGVTGTAGLRAESGPLADDLCLQAPHYADSNEWRELFMHINDYLQPNS